MQMELYSEFTRDIGLAILYLPIGALISAVILRWLNSKIARFVVPYARAFRIEIIIGTVYLVCVVSLYISGRWIEDKSALNVVILILSFLVGAPFYAKMLKHPERGPIGWVKGTAYSLIFGAMDVVLQLSVTIVPILALSMFF